jgi:hypothetical protein
MNHLVRGLGLSIALATAVAFPSAAAVIADMGVDFSIASNPNGNWTYASASTIGGSLTLLTVTSASGGFATIQAPGGSGPFVSANLLGTSLVVTSTSSITLDPHEAAMHPAEDGRYAVARLTVPVTLTGTFSVLFDGIDSVGPTTDVHVQVNLATVFSDSIAGTGDTATYTVSGLLTAGTTIDLYVGTGGNDWFYDTTGVTATLTDVPEPVTLGLFGLGLAALASVRWRGVR